MSKQEMTPMQRVLTALSHKEPDKVPLFLLLSMYGAKVLRTSIQEYFSQPEAVTEGQLLMRERYQHDCYYTFYYASVEIEAWGGETIFVKEGAPNAGSPIVYDITNLKPPSVKTSAILQRVLQTTSQIKQYAKSEVPIIGVVMSPFSLPVMQMGFENYINLLYRQPDDFQKLMQVNQEFCIEWANAQLLAGATAICYFDPLASPSMIPRELYLKLGYKVAQTTIAAIKGPTAMHLASGRSGMILADLMQTGTSIIGVSQEESLAQLKTACQGRVTILGNLNGIAMRHWTQDETKANVKKAITAGARGGGFILSDSHGEIPWNVPEDVLYWTSEAVREFGKYPL